MNRMFGRARVLSFRLLGIAAMATIAAILPSCQGSRPPAPAAKDPRSAIGFAAPRHAERRHDFDVLHRVLRLEPDFSSATIRGEVTIRFASLVPGFRVLQLDADHLSIQKVVREGPPLRPLPFEHKGAVLRIRLDAPLEPQDTATITIAYTGKPVRGMWFNLPDEAHPTRTPQLWTQGEPEDARFWFPCYDAPNDRATTEMVATVPEGFEAVSNGRLEERRTLEDGRVRFHWITGASLPAYLVSLVAGRFDVLEDSWEGIPLLHYVPPGRLEEARRSFGRTGEMLSFFSDRIGVRYPYAKYAHVCVRDFSFGGMENLSATTVTESTLHPARVHETSSSDGLVAHEMAHQWFGDLVTCRSWAHIWLNEGFASFFGILGDHHGQGEDEVAYQLLRSADQVIAADAGESRRAVVSNVYHAPIDLFDTYAYPKGAWVLRMLEGELGEDFFWQGIQQWVERYRESAATTDDLRRVMEDVSGRHLEWFFRQWCTLEGHPVFEVSWEWQAGGAKGVLVRWKQVQPSSHGRVPRFRGTVRIRLVGEGEESSMLVPFVPEDGSTFLAAKKPPRFVSFDDGGYVLKEVDWKRPEEEAVRQLQEDREALGRVWAAREIGKAGTPEGTAALAEAMERDRFWGVRAEAAAALARIDSDEAAGVLVDALDDPDARVRIAVCRALAKRPTEESVDPLRSLLSRETNDDVLAAALGAFAAQEVEDEDAWAVLESFAGRDSHGEVVRIASLAARASRDAEHALDALLEAADPARPTRLRERALELLGTAGEGRDDVRVLLEKELDHGSFRTRRAAVKALGRLGDPAAEPRLVEVATDPTADGRVRAAARRAIASVRKAASSSE